MFINTSNVQFINGHWSGHAGYYPMKMVIIIMEIINILYIVFFVTLNSFDSLGVKTSAQDK